MKQKHIKVRLAEILRPLSRPETVNPEKIYDALGCRWYAGGLYIKESKPGAQFQASKLYRVEEGDFVYNRLFAWKGSFAVATKATHGCYVSNEFPCFTINSERAYSQYLRWYFTIQSVWDEALGLSSGGTAISRNRLKEEKFLSLLIPLPTLEEQRRIVARIEELAAKIEEARGLRRGATAKTTGLLDAFISNLNLSEECWAKVRAAVLESKVAVRSGPFGSQLHHDEFVDSGVPAIGTRDVQVNRFALKSGWYVTQSKFQQFKRYQVFPGDLLTTDRKSVV